MIITEKEINSLVDEETKKMALSMIEELKKIAETCIKDELSLETQMMMIGIANTLTVQVENLKNLLPEDELQTIDNEIQKIWNRWYEKNRLFQKEFTQNFN